MAIFATNSLARKMTSLTLVTGSIALGTLTLALLLFDTIDSKTLLYNRLSTLAEVVGQNAAPALNFNDPAAAVEVLEALRAEPPVVSACLYDPAGQLFAHYERQGGSKSCPTTPGHVSNDNPHYRSVVRPVTRHGELVGSLLLKSDLQNLEQRRRRLLLVAGLLLLLALAIGGIAGSLLQRTIAKPIFDLVAAMQHVTARQDFSTRVPISGCDEIVQLGVGFNTMLTELERRDAGKRNAEAKLQFQALNDPLTRLPNRRLFGDRLAQVLAVARRESRMVALLYIDLDGFKLVNDSLGHPVGDHLLVEVAARLQSRVRQSDTLARLGGDEFTVILSGLHAKEEAALVAKTLLDVLAAPFVIEGHQLTIGASIGISLFPENAKDAAHLMQQADSAMYAAKRDGKNRATYFTREIGSFVRERLNLENQLRGAIARHEIEVHYQPEFEVSSNRLVRFEALARWLHPTLGKIPPDKFIPVAEESGLIVTLGAYILETACAEAVRWQSMADHPIQVAVNVSSIQFRREHFVDEVKKILKRTGLPPELLQLELTESVMLNGVGQTAEVMHRFHDLGVSLAIDDFGTGYSCLSYLPVLPFDALKIDRAFVRELSIKDASRVMVHSLVDLAHNIGMRVIVEGVENTDQLRLIRELGGNEIQGYLLGEPSPNPASTLSTIMQKGQVAAEGKAFSEADDVIPVS